MCSEKRLRVSDMSSVSESKSGVEDFDTGQRGGGREAGPSGRPGDLLDEEDAHSRPRLRTSLVNQDSVLAEEAQSGVLLTEITGPTGLREKGLADTALLERTRRSTADGVEPLSSSAEASASGVDRGSSLRGGGSATVGGSTDRREVPAGGRESMDNSSSGSGTFRSKSRALGLQHSVSGKKRAPWQIDLGEVDLGELVSNCGSCLFVFMVKQICSWSLFCSVNLP